jgi:arsenite-transporting ATPase
MRLLEDMPAFIFFAGKGGVGKTSMSCATAVHLAAQGRRVLLVSTDPASNVGQVFGQRIGNRITPLSEVPGVSALEIDPESAAADYRDRIVAQVQGTVPADALAGVREQLSGACTTEVAAFDEFTAVLTDPAVTGRYDHVVFDTAPTGHTIRLLSLPAAWSGFIEANPAGSSCLGPLAGLEQQRRRYADAVDALADPTRTRLVLVARPQRGSLDEAARTHDELAAIGIGRQHLVINGLLPQGEGAVDPLAAALYRREQAAVSVMPAPLRDLPTDRIDLMGFDLIGVTALRALFDHHGDAGPATTPADATKPSPVDLPGLEGLVDEIAAAGRGLVMTVGKGGVGKTTIAAAIAVALAARGLPVHLTTTDPAGHPSDTLSGSLDGLYVSRIDPLTEIDRYRRQVLDTKGRGLDPARRALLEEDLRSPCTEEIAVFQAFARAVRDARNRIVVMDTAPTGHTLLLLDATGAYHRDATRHIVGKGLRVVTPLMQLQDPGHTKVIIVTLAETTPVLEAAGLQDDLRRAGIEPWAWVINNSVAAARPDSPLLRRRAEHEVDQIAMVRDRHATRLALVPLLTHEPVGVDHLLRLAGDPAVDVAGGREGVVDRAVPAQVEVQQLDPAGRFVGDQPQLGADGGEPRWRVLAAGDHVNLGAAVAERQEPAGPLDILKQTGGKRRGQQLPGPGSSDVPVAQDPSNSIVSEPALTLADPAGPLRARTR